ncbi:flavin monoamine oxidase family protein [Streptomyces sp. NRRL S-1521]|uniref:flavin monoamine oxidase family protein n=1 Tax=Streptomyces sp. NRRL S-1521 TaxID=1609100 RepID=UPI00099F2DA5|nr:NAD(P)/FAD-dependent oxidoreductase [Streptomyces sp. NRRL S-1521]
MADKPTPACDLQVDFPFDYAAHLSEGRRIGRLPKALCGAPVAVVGAGGSGLSAAYELMRAGCRPALFEAEASAEGPGGRRLGGRMYSHRVDDADSAVAELGCMRFPDSSKLLRQYARNFGLHWQPSRDNYATATPKTVLNMDGVSHETRTLADVDPGNRQFRQARLRWLRAVDGLGLSQLLREAANRDLPAMRRRWGALVAEFEKWTFYRFLRDEHGAGLSHAQARLLGTAGIGPGMWDSFFDVSMLEVLRMLMVTQGATHYFPLEGISALAEGFWTHRTTDPTGRPVSLDEINAGVLRPEVTALDIEEDAQRGVVVHSADARSERFAAVIFTPQLHMLETTVEVRSTTPGGAAFGPRLLRAIRRLNYWPASKTLLVTREPFWEGTSLDGVTITDRLPRATYTTDYGPARRAGGRRGVIDLSYSWGQDAMKISASGTEERVRLFVRELAAIHPEAAEELRQQAQDGVALTISWENQRNFRGMCRLSRPGDHLYQRDLFSHFMKDFTGRPAVPGEPRNALFLAGDDTAWSPGWLDHALSSGINAAWGVLKLLGGGSDPGNPGPGDLWDHPDYTLLSTSTD